MTNTNEWKTAGANTGLKTDRSWNHETEKEISGIYMETREVKKKDGKTTMIYVIKTDKELVTVWGAAMIDRLMKEASIGNEVKITFIKKSFNQSTGKYLNEFTMNFRDVPKTTEIKDEINDVKEEKKTGDKPVGDDIPF